MIMVELLLSCLLLLPAPVHHQDDSSNDPPGSHLKKWGLVLRLGPPGAWDAGMVESPMVWFDAHRKRYAMVYSGYGSTDSTHHGYHYVTRPQIGLAWSDDLLHWEKDEHNPVYSGSGVEGLSDSHGATGPFVWYENGTYYLYTIGVTSKGYEKGKKTLNLATSTDLYHWKRFEGNPVIAPSGNGWRRDAVWHPNIVKNGSTYFLFFNASGLVGELHEEFIGYATSTDLFHWKVDDDHSPILMGSHKPGAWDASGRAGDPSVYKVGHKWYMAWYSWDRVHSSDGLAWTSEKEFPLGWRVYKKNPVLSVGPPGSYDALHAGKPFIFRTADKYFHFYTAVALDETRQIAVAIAE